MIFGSRRVRWMVQIIADSLRINDTQVMDFLKSEKNEELIKNFLEGNGSRKFMVYYQVEDIQSHEGAREANADPSLFITNGDVERIKDKAIVFLRNLPEGKKDVKLDEDQDSEVLFLEVNQNILKFLNNSMELVYQQFVERMDTSNWEQCEQESIDEFVNLTKKFGLEVHDAIQSMDPGQELFSLDNDEKNNSLNENDKMQIYEKKFQQWLGMINALLNDEGDQKKESLDAGPLVEIEYWRNRMQKITTWCEQLKGKDFNIVKNAFISKNKQHEMSQRGGGNETISKLMNDYNRLDLQLTDKLNEAKDNFKYLSTLEKFIEPLYNGTPEQIIETLPALMNTIKMIHTIARFYNTADKMTSLFMKITNQMITNCKNRILDGKKSDDIWNREPAQLISVLESCIRLNKAYKDCYKETKDKVADMQRGSGHTPFDFTETQIFGKFDLLCRRVAKLIEIFTTIQQFQSLAKHNLENMEDLTNEFQNIIKDFQSKRHDLMNYASNNFDLEYVQFTTKIQDLDTKLQTFIDENFSKFRNIEYSIRLLHKFENTLKRDTLRHSLTNKYNSILQTYATELDNIQRIFTEKRGKPNIVRNMPNDAGKIIWAKHLFQKITAPISLFPDNLLKSAEIKKFYGSYNNLGKQLTVYEMWYYQNWTAEIEKSKAALQATLIVRSEDTKHLFVNFDIEIMQLIREAKCLDRFGVGIPESARIILLQEEKFKLYYNELQYAIKEHQRIIQKIKPITKNLLSSHLEDLELKLRPGMVTLTWTSMNIDSYLEHVHAGLNKLEQLIINVNDIIENRIENNLKAVSKILLVSLPSDSNKPFSLEQFVRLQEEFIVTKTTYLISKNLEVERAVDDLLQTIILYPLDSHVDPILPEETRRIKRYYFWYLYQALLNSTQNSLNAMKYRVCGKRQVTSIAESKNLTALKPFFEVHVKLDQDTIILNPSLDEIQKAINKAATAVLRCSKYLYNWEQQDKNSENKASLYEMIAQDKEIVKVILLLTGSIQGTRQRVNDFKIHFDKFNHLWSSDINDTIKKFEKKNPSIQEYEDILKKYSIVDEDIEKIQNSHLIGAMELKTEGLCNGLKHWSKEWKSKYAENLHKRARNLLDQQTEKTKHLDIRLRKEVRDIDSLGMVMETLEDIRTLQAEIDMKFTPINEMYNLLENFLQNGLQDKEELDARTMLNNNWQSVIKYAEEKQKDLQQKQTKYLVDLKISIKDFGKDVKTFRKDYELNGPMVENIKPKEAIERLRRFEDEYSVKDNFYKINKKGEDLFGLQNQKYPELEKTQAEIKNLRKLYGLYSEVIESIQKWKEKAWSDFGVEMLNEMTEQIQKYGDMCIRLPKDLKDWNAYKELKAEIDNLKDVLPIIIDIKKQNIKDRHWKAICDITGKLLDYEHEDIMNFNDLLDANFLNHQDEIMDQIEAAEKQQKIEKQLNEINDTWRDYEFEFSNWGTRDQPCILSGLKVGEINEKLEEDQMTLTTLNAQRHVGPFKEEVEKQIRIFSDVETQLDWWIKVQMLWTSLEAVFTGGDIAKQMPLESRKFQQIDKQWMRLMEKAVETKKIIPCCQNELLKQSLPGLYKDLEICQKSLEQYLEGKRKKFPRMYFVSGPTLLKILSQGSEPTSIQEDFEKLFDAINRVIFDKNQEKKGTNEKIIKAIISVMGKDEETVYLNTVTKCEGLIEGWLSDLERQMQVTVKDVVRQASSAVFNMNLKDFIVGYISQVALLGLQMKWTALMTEAFEKASNKNEKGTYEAKKKEINGMMDTLTQLCLEEHKSQIDRVKIETLVTIMVHQKELTAELKCKDVSDFDWQKQTRIYWKNDIDNCIISITDWDAPYCYEFLGAKERLCITKLTDRCYITLAQAMSMFYGGAPAGPAGTGKTETVKDLGRTLGIFVVVTNCSDQHRYGDMAQIFKGLVQSGLWGCFDEFNRIQLDVLSVVAMQVESISAAKKQGLTNFDFPDEKGLGIVQSVGYFITMNPGYAGRQELPENLKVLFRSVSMMVPDRETIIKVKLASVGFSSIESLAKKFNILYKLCEEQLSKQRHYDFGLRNILSVLRTAGNTIKNERPKNPHEEEMLMMRALRDMNLSKLVSDDIPLFNSLLVDIFPKQTNVPKMMYTEIENQVKVLIDNQNLVPNPAWLLKIVQVYETSLVRHGFMLVGPTGVGKTTIINILTESLHQLNQPHKITRINPKAITTEEMYGVKSEISDDWIPGIFSTIWSKSNQRSSKFTTWITFDGPVDTIWIESLNTVLDDNKILTLANGERIPMTENCKLVFEVENLNNASPATVSRCGQVYISSTDLGYEAVIKGYCQRRKAELNQNDHEKLRIILNKYFIQYNVLGNLERLCKNQVMFLENICYVTNSLNLLNGFLLPYSGKNLTEQELERLCVLSICWALGGVYENQDRQAFNEWMLSKGAPLPSKLKENETVYDYYLDSSKGTPEWKVCAGDVWNPPDKNFQFSQLLLPTVDSFRAEFLINAILNQPKQIKNPLCQKSVLLIGGSGTAKTSSILMYSDKLGKKNQLFKRINFSSATRPATYQANIEVECDTKVGKDFAPPENKILNVFIDDMSMPEVNAWGDQETLEIVRQLIETGGFFMLDKTMRGTFKNIKNLQFIGAMNHPIGGRNDIPNRAKRNFLIFNMILPQSVESIYAPIINFCFKAKYFSDEFNKIIGILPFATAILWNKVKSTILPTPSKFHYVFNMRELSRIFKGILQVRRDVICSTTRLEGMSQQLFAVALWRHECERVFCDKLISVKDKETILTFINEISLESFSHLQQEIEDKLMKKEKYIYYCDFLRPDKLSEEGYIEEYAEKIYEGVNDLGKLKERCLFLLEQYNTKFPSKKMNLVLFDDAVKHLLKISRIIQMQRSSALLVGVGGSGKQSLTKLAAEIGRQNVYQIVITKNFQEKDLKEELKNVYDLAAHAGKKTTFIMTDQEVKKEEFLEYINMLLSTGEIPGLLQKDDREIWLGDITSDYMKERGTAQQDPTNAELYTYLVDRLRDNLHIVLCFSPVGSKFRDRSRKFPALFNECSINWFLPWPEEALVSVASSYISQFDGLDTKKEIKIELQKHMGNVHLMVQEVCDLYFTKMRRRVWVTPKSFLSYINLYQKYYNIKYYGELDIQEKSFKKGLAKIQEAALSIAEMEVILKSKEAVLKEAAEKTESMLKDLEKEQAKVNKKQQEVAAKTKLCQLTADTILSEKAIAEKELEAAMPALLAADSAVASLSPKDIVDLKANKNPMPLIKYIMDTVAIFQKEKLQPVSQVSEQISKKDPAPIQFLKDSFEDSKALLQDANFRLSLIEFKKDQISEETMELLSVYTSDQSPLNQHFNFDSASKISVAAAGILKWVLAIQEYHIKSKIVKPRKANLIISEGKLSSAMAELKINQDNLAIIQEQMEELKNRFSKQMEEKMKLEQNMNQTKKKINSARSLIGSLQDERDRWQKGDSEIGEQKRRLVGNVSLATAFISYCGPFNSEFRDILSNQYISQDMKKRGIPITPDLNLVNFLVNDATVGEWNIQGLPKDDLSIQNGIMVTNSTRYPMIIDPQVQGENWIRNKYAETIDQFRSITNLQNPKFKDQYLKYCMEEGMTLIIQGIENEVDPIIDPVLEKQAIKKGKGYIIDVAGSQMDFNINFTMFLTCRLPNPEFSPELSAKTTIIDFTVTQKGLEQQLLSRVLSKEQKALEDSLNQLLADVNKNKKDLSNLDKDLLERLMSSTGNLLDDIELMDVLNLTKIQSKEVAVKLIDAEQKTKQINENREQYRPVAIRGSALYFCIIELQFINWMYNSSLEQFLKLFDYAIDKSEKAALAIKRVEIIINFLTYHVYQYINRGLFEKDKVTYVLMICFKIAQTSGKISGADISVFLKSGASLDLRSEKVNNYKFISDKVWLNLLALSRHHFSGDNIAFFRELPEFISRNEQSWKQFVEKNEPENYPIPDYADRIGGEKEIGAFLTLCLIRSIREDRSLVACQQFITSIVGNRFTDPLSYPIDTIYQESNNAEPIIYLLSAGADPTQSIDELARKKKKITNKVSMGEGQEKTAKVALANGQIEGNWVILQNCHLGLSLMEEILEILRPDQDRFIHEEFRLWITCEPINKFPLRLLQNSIKVTDEAPKGLRAGIYKTFSTLINQDFIDKIDHSSWRSLIFVLCFMHSVVIERKKFGPIGWCVPYEFNNSDLEASLTFIDKYLTQLIGTTTANTNLPINCNVIKYMICEVQYGGRITDDLDRELFNAYGDDYIRDNIFGNDVILAKCPKEGSKEFIEYKMLTQQQAVEIKYYRNYSNLMQMTDSPEIFGLHANADLNYRLKESLEMINTVIQTRPKDSSAVGGKTREELVQDKAKEILQKIPQDYNMNEVKELLKKLVGPKGLNDKGLTVPLNVFLYQELQRIQRVLSIVRTTCTQIVEAIDGQIIMTPQIVNAIDSVSDAKVPNNWIYDATGAEIAWLMPNLGGWIAGLSDRNNQLNSWLKNNRPPTFWLTGFFNPQGFLTAMKQEVTRINKNKPAKAGADKDKDQWSLDDVSYITQVKDIVYENIKDIQSEGVYVHGLSLEGAKWYKSMLEDPEPKKMFAPLPILYVSAQNKKKPDEKMSNSFYSCPVYKYPRKTDKYFVFRVNLACEASNSKWKLRGVSLLCSQE